MSEKSTTPDLVPRVRGLYAAANRGDLDATVGFFAPGAVWEAMMEGASFEGVEGIIGLAGAGNSTRDRSKNGKGRRVPIAGALRSILAEHLLGLGRRDGFVFGASPTSGFQPTVVPYRADKAWKKANVQRIVLHECRHTFASLMIAEGVDAKASAATRAT